MTTIRVITYNIRKGKGNGQGKPEFSALAESLREWKADLVLFQEVFHNRQDVDQSDALATGLAAEWRYGANAQYRRGHHGNTTVSKWPILTSENRDLSTNPIERRGCLYTRIESPFQTPLHVLNTHFGLSHRQRRTQAERVGNWLQQMTSPGEPVILGGDFNDWSGRLDPEICGRTDLQNAMTRLSALDRKTWSTRRPLFALDRLYIRGLTISEVRVLRDPPFDRLSDHFPVLAVFEVPTPRTVTP